MGLDELVIWISIWTKWVWAKEYWAHFVAMNLMENVWPNQRDGLHRSDGLTMHHDLVCRY